MDVITTTSIKQGSRVIHPIYARVAKRDIDKSNEDILPMQLEPIGNEVSRSVTFRTSRSSYDLSGTMCSSVEKRRLSESKPALDMPDTQRDPRWDQEETRCEATRTKVINSPVGETTADQRVPAIIKDLEKNQKSSLDQKRFYKRKFIGFSVLKHLPTGRLLRFFRPPLQRRNSCPALSVAELQAGSSQHQEELLPKQPVFINHRSSENKTARSSDRNWTFRTSKWTSQSESRRTDKSNDTYRNSSAEELSNNCINAGSSDDITSTCIKKQYSEIASVNTNPLLLPPPEFENRTLVKSARTFKGASNHTRKESFKRSATDTVFCKPLSNSDKKTVIIVPNNCNELNQNQKRCSSSGDPETLNYTHLNSNKKPEVEQNNDTLKHKEIVQSQSLEETRTPSLNSVSESVAVVSNDAIKHDCSNKNITVISGKNHIGELLQNCVISSVRNSETEDINNIPKTDFNEFHNHFQINSHNSIITIQTSESSFRTEEQKSLNLNENSPSTVEEKEYNESCILDLKKTIHSCDILNDSKSTIVESNNKIFHSNATDLEGLNQDLNFQKNVVVKNDINCIITDRCVQENTNTEEISIIQVNQPEEFCKTDAQTIIDKSNEAKLKNSETNEAINLEIKSANEAKNSKNIESEVTAYTDKSLVLLEGNNHVDISRSDKPLCQEARQTGNIPKNNQIQLNNLIVINAQSNKHKTDSKQKSKLPTTEARLQQPQLISITCNKAIKRENSVLENQCKIEQIRGIKVNISSEYSSQHDVLDFGEHLSSAASLDFQSGVINECYNVKLDAPEEVIVAGFHDFCHTMLSLEEAGESDTGTIKRKTEDKKIKDTEEINKLNSMNHVNKQIVNIFNGNDEHKQPHLANSTMNLDAAKEKLLKTPSHPSGRLENTTDKLLEEIQKSKLMEKQLSFKDSDVQDAIRALDMSLIDATNESFASQARSLSSTNSEILLKRQTNVILEIKNYPKAPKEDKVQCDNLIEELMLEDADKRVLNSIETSTISRRGGGIAVTISNMTSHQYSKQERKFLPNESLKIDNDSIIDNLDNKTQSKEKLEFDSPLSNYNLSPDSDTCNFNNSSSSTDNSSDSFSASEEYKRENLMTQGKENSVSPSVSITSEDTNATLPLQISVENGSMVGSQDIAAYHRTSPCSVDSGTSSHNQGYFVVVAIDFGTTYSGYAFSFTRDPDNIHMMKKWDGGDPGVFNQKTPTTLLLTPEETFHSFGYSARDYYHDLDMEEAKEWLYFDKFKMALHKNEHLSMETKISAANGKAMPAVKVFAHALRYFKDYALQELSDQSATRILNEDVRWVVTVPAIWKQPAKQFMRAAAYKAGIASPECADQLLIALEPEAASIYCRRIKLHQLIPQETQYQRQLQWQRDEKDSESDIGSTISDKELSNFQGIPSQGLDGSFPVGTRYMIVDCGGGTVDIIIHELLDKHGTLKELQKASGGPYGSMGVDMEFENLLGDIFGTDFMEQFKAKRPTGYVDLMIAFEARKRNASPYKSNPLNISLPFSFIDYYRKCKGVSVEAALKKSSHKDVKWSQGMLRLELSAMEKLFRNTVNQIREHIESILSKSDLCVEHLFLVGGFAESLILQKEIKNSFSPKLKVLIPQGVSLAILKGAVLFGLDPTIVNIRRLRMTYGVGVLTHFIHGVHPREKLVLKDGIQWCADVFDKFVVTDQSVGVGDVVVRSYTPAKAGQSCSVIHIYCSEKDNVYFITDHGVKRCGTLILDLSESRYVQSREIQTRMMFGDTEIKVSALDVTTGKCVKSEVDFLNY